MPISQPFQQVVHALYAVAHSDNHQAQITQCFMSAFPILLLSLWCPSKVAYVDVTTLV